jgi:hypothetical protein
MRKTSLEWFCNKYGFEDGTKRYDERRAKISKSRKSSVLSKFVKNPNVVKILQGKVINQKQVELLEDFFTNHKWLRHRALSAMVAHWILRDIYDWEDRYQKLIEIGMHKSTLESFILRYGDTDGPIIYDKTVNKKVRHFKNRVEYWIDNGLDIKDAISKVREVQQHRGKLSRIRKESNPSYKLNNQRFIEYWLARGLTLEQALKAQSDVQRRDLNYFVNKYGETEGSIRYECSKLKRKSTWLTKDKIQHARSTTPKTFNPAGQEMQAIESFILANNIDRNCCKFGSPKDQYWAQIPGVGFRRYDLAVFTDRTHTQLSMIMEYHGPGHINFSDYTESMRHERISINGKKLIYLGTYGEAYDNDKAKREYIENLYPDVLYIVMWHGDLKEKRFRIDELRQRKI